MGDDVIVLFLGSSEGVVRKVFDQFPNRLRSKKTETHRRFGRPIFVAAIAFYICGSSTRRIQRPCSMSLRSVSFRVDIVGGAAIGNDVSYCRGDTDRRRVAGQQGHGL